MNFNEDIIEEIVKYASISINPNTICKLLDLPIWAQFEDEFNTAYEKGLAIADAELMKKISNLSKQGSSPAQTLLKKKINENNSRRIFERD